MEAVLRGSASFLESMAERQAQRRRKQAMGLNPVQQVLAVQVVKLLLHLAGFGAFIWTGFQLHSVAGGLSIMISCFALSWLMNSTSTKANENTDPLLRG